MPAVLNGVVSSVLDRLEKVRQHADGNGWEARCPAHDDRHASLSVSVGKEGQVLLHCHAGCAFADVLVALDLKVRDLWPQEDAPSNNGRGKVAAVYRYQDEAGVVVLEVVRYEPKGFAQRRPLDDGHAYGIGEGYYRRRGAKSWTPLKAGEEQGNQDRYLKAANLVLYRLPELLASGAEETVYVVEGEKDADALAALGLVATTNPMGSGKWRKSYTGTLRGRRVVLLPDNDDPGRRHAHDVAKVLDGVAAAVGVLELSGLPVKGDVSDWLAAGGDRGKLEALAKAAAEGAPKITAADVATIDDLILAGSTVTWGWHLWLPLGVLTVLASDAGIGKTRFCADLLRRVRHGLPWPDGTPMTLSPDTIALWVASDNHHDQLVTISQEFAVKDAIRLNASREDPFGGVLLDAHEDLTLLEARIRAVNARIVFVDTVGNATDRNLSKQEDAKGFYQPLQIMARRTHTALVCVTHLNASGAVLGRRAVEKVRVVMKMERPDPEAQPDRRRLEVTKTFDRYPPSLGITMKTGSNDYDTSPPERVQEPGQKGAGPTKLRECIDWLQGRLEKGPVRVSITRTEAENSGFTSGTLYRAHDHLGVQEYSSEGKKWWKLTPSTPSVHAGLSSCPDTKDVDSVDNPDIEVPW